MRIDQRSSCTTLSLPRRPFSALIGQLTHVHNAEYPPRRPPPRPLTMHLARRDPIKLLISSSEKEPTKKKKGYHLLLQSRAWACSTRNTYFNFPANTSVHCPHEYHHYRFLQQHSARVYTWPPHHQHPWPPGLSGGHHNARLSAVHPRDRPSIGVKASLRPPTSLPVTMAMSTSIPVSPQTSHNITTRAPRMRCLYP